MKRAKVTGQRFEAHNPQPENGRGFLNFAFEDNRKDCLCDESDTVCWAASLSMKAFSADSGTPDPEKDLLLMEAAIELEVQFAIGAEESPESLVPLVRRSPRNHWRGISTIFPSRSCSKR
jgi:hypothetical protein